MQRAAPPAANPRPGCRTCKQDGGTGTGGGIPLPAPLVLRPVCKAQRGLASPPSTPRPWDSLPSPADKSPFGLGLPLHSHTSRCSSVGGYWLIDWVFADSAQGSQESPRKLLKGEGDEGGMAPNCPKSCSPGIRGALLTTPHSLLSPWGPMKTFREEGIHPGFPAWVGRGGGQASSPGERGISVLSIRTTAHGTLLSLPGTAQKCVPLPERGG